MDGDHGKVSEHYAVSDLRLELNCWEDKTEASAVTNSANVLRNPEKDRIRVAQAVMTAEA